MVYNPIDMSLRRGKHGTFDSPSHSQLIEYAVRWLARVQKCTVIITDMAHAGSETPDAIGWSATRGSHLVECKASRADFFTDHKKHFRTYTGPAMGDYRWYLSGTSGPNSSEVPDGWGLLTVLTDGRILRSCDAVRQETGNRKYERDVLCSALRRMVLAPGIRGIKCQTYVIDGEGEPRATVRVMEPACEVTTGG